MTLANHKEVFVGELFEEQSREVANNPPPWALSAYFYDRDSLKIKDVSDIEKYLEEYPVIRGAYEEMLMRSKERRLRAVKRQTS